MQLKDIDHIPILRFLAENQTKWCNWFPLSCANSVQNAFPEQVRGTKLVLCKMQNLQRRKLVSGCSCGCRGDYVITDKGLDMVGMPIHPKRAHIY